MGVASAVIAIGCGSSSDDGTGAGGGASTEKAAFVKQASAACSRPREQAFEKVAIYQRKHRKDGLSESELTDASIRAALLSTVAAELAALRKLTPPAGDEEAVEAILATLEQNLEKARKAKNVPAEKLEGSYFVDSSKELSDYGIPDCTK